MHLHDIETLLARQGWRLHRITGSHRHYRNLYGQLLTLSAHGRRTFSQTELKILRGDLERLTTERRRQAASQRRTRGDESEAQP